MIDFLEKVKNLNPWSKAPSSMSQVLRAGGTPQGPYTELFDAFIARKVVPELYEGIREAVPIVDTAIEALTTLDGIIRVDGDNKGLVHELEDWMEEVKVNDLQNGLQSFIENFDGETYEQGFGIADFVTDKNRTKIVGFNVADSKNIRFRRINGKLEIFYKGLTDRKGQPNRASTMTQAVLEENFGTASFTSLRDNGWVKLNPTNLLYHSIANENSGPYGISIMRGAEFDAKILLTIKNTLAHVWERFGDPMFHVNVKGVKQSNAGKLKTDIENDMKTLIEGKRAGKSGDLVTVGDSNSEVTIKVIGADGQVLEIEAPIRAVEESIIGRTGLPSWMLGRNWSTTERLAKYQVEMLLTRAQVKGNKKLNLLNRVKRQHLILRGRSYKKGAADFYFEQPSLSDIVGKAQARFLNAQADMYDNEYGDGANSDDTKKGKREVLNLTSKGHGTGCGCRKSVRPVPNPELDRVEVELINDLKVRWSNLLSRVYTILKLDDYKDIKAKDKFEPTEEQKAEVRRAFEDFKASLDPTKDKEETLFFHYGQAYATGVLFISKSNEQSQPYLNEIMNSKTVQNLVSEGFTLVKESTTQILKSQIMTEIEAQVLAGANPVHMANRLSAKFGDANSNWERFVRSEMAMASELGKIEEATEEGLKLSYLPTAGACPVCEALKGTYSPEEAPLPVRDTHPRCYCTLVVANN